VAGLAVGLLLWWLLPALIARLESGSEVRRRAALEHQLPLVAGLLAACLSSGATLERSLAIVGAAVPQPARSALEQAAASAALGGEPGDVAAVLAAAGSPGWQALGGAVVRSATTGAPLADLLHAQADQALLAWFAAASARARAVAVRSVLPLALCFLPAFLLLGVAPVVAGLLDGVAVP
jgi:Flp pilus assembly protein TadB